MTLENDKAQDKKFLKQVFPVFIKKFCIKGEGETLPKWILFLSNFKNTKTNIFLTTLILPNFWMKLAIFCDAKKVQNFFFL